MRYVLELSSDLKIQIVDSWQQQKIVTHIFCSLLITSQPAITLQSNLRTTISDHILTDVATYLLWNYFHESSRPD